MPTAPRATPRTAPRAAPCPICDKPADPHHRPFCSRGCRDRDLLQWLGEGYRLPGATLGEDGDDPDGLDTGAARP